MLSQYTTTIGTYTTIAACGKAEQPTTRHGSQDVWQLSTLSGIHTKSNVIPGGDAKLPAGSWARTAPIMPHMQQQTCKHHTIDTHTLAGRVSCTILGLRSSQPFALTPFTGKPSRAVTSSAALAIAGSGILGMGSSRALGGCWMLALAA